VKDAPASGRWQAEACPWSFYIFHQRCIDSMD